MYFIKSVFRFIFTFCLIFTLADDLLASPGEMIDGYINSIIDENWDQAKNFWAPSSMAMAERLGIEYIDNPLKCDLASPVYQYRDGIRTGQIAKQIVDIVRVDHRTEIKVRLSHATDSIDYSYYAIENNGGWYLVSRQEYFASDWPKIETKYFRLCYQDSSLINSIALARLDEFTETTGRTLGLTDDDLRLLQTEKIGYYLCDSDQMDNISGHDSNGMTDYQFDALISRHLPHEHELTHFLINYSLRKLHLYTLPILQEGIACALGGRWDKSPDVVAYSGYMILHHELYQLEDILTWTDFHQNVAMADITYPISCLFVDYLLENIDMEKFKFLYTALSASESSTLRRISRDEIKDYFCDIMGLTWPDIEKGFNKYWRNNTHAGFGHTMYASLIMPALQIEYPGGHMQFLDRGNIYELCVFLPDSVTCGEFFLTPREINKADKSYMSPLYDRQFPDSVYQGQRFSYIFNPSEIGLYDYATNKLIAKILFDLHERQMYYSLEYHQLTLSFDKNLLGGIDLSQYDLTVKLD